MSYKYPCSIIKSLYIHFPTSLIFYHGVINFSKAASAARESVNKVASNQSIMSVDSAIGSLHHVNDEAAKLILECKKDIRNNPELYSAVGDYFANSLQTLDLCNALDNCLKCVLDRQLTIVVALQQYENETKEKSFEEEMYRKTLEELKKNFTDLVNPFDDEFFRIFQETSQRQHEMLKRLEVRREKMKKRERSTKTWGTVSKVLFVATLVGVLIMSVVSVAIGAPPVLSALLGALSFPIDYMGKWINALWKSYETRLTGEFKLVDSMHRGTYIADQDLDNIHILVNKLETEIKSVSHNAGEEDTVKFVTERIKKGLSSFSERTEELTNQTASCHKKIMDTRTVILQQIINHPCNSL